MTTTKNRIGIAKDAVKLPDDIDVDNNTILDLFHDATSILETEAVVADKNLESEERIAHD